jgi:hypothetical protein
MDELKLEKMDPDFDRIILDDDQKEYRFMQGTILEQEMIREFPDEEKAIRQSPKPFLKSAIVFHYIVCVFWVTEKNRKPWGSQLKIY